MAFPVGTSLPDSDLYSSWSPLSQTAVLNLDLDEDIKPFETLELTGQVQDLFRSNDAEFLHDGQAFPSSSLNFSSSSESAPKQKYGQLEKLRPARIPDFIQLIISSSLMY